MGSHVRNVTTIAAKEIRSYYGSPVAWVLLGLFAFIFGYFFTIYLRIFLENSLQGQFGGPSEVNVNRDMIRGLLGNTTVLILFLLPMVTMRSYSEEKRSGTIELLLTSPITDGEILFGKFIGALGLFAGIVIITALYILALFPFGNPEVAPLFAGYLGLVLLGGCFISLGLFISSTTKNMMVAGAATFIFSLLFWIIGWFGESGSSTVGTILSYLSITGHFDDFAKGIIDTKHIVFYVSFISFFLFLTLKSTDAERWRG